MKIPTKWRPKGGDRSGQALVEFIFVGFILLVMLFGMIDCCRAISTRLVLINLSREGANQAARGSGITIDAAISNAISAVIAGASPLDINAHGQVIISAVFNNNGVYTITHQASAGMFTQPSKVGVLNASGSGSAGSGVTMPYPATDPGAIPQANQTAYVAELFYNFSPATPLGNVVVGGLRGITVTNQLYDVAYF